MQANRLLLLVHQVAADEYAGDEDEHRHGHHGVLEGRHQAIPLGIQVHDEPIAADGHEAEEEDGGAKDAAQVGPLLGVPPARTGS